MFKFLKKIRNPHKHSYGKWRMSKVQLKPVAFGYIQVCYERACSCGHLEMVYTPDTPVD